MGLESGVRMGQMRSHTHKHTGAYVQTHTERCYMRVTLTHEAERTHTRSQTHTKIITIITLAHAQAIIYSNIQLHMQESTPGYNLSIA